ncbi:MAG: sugar porter family MFS transporter [Legionella sp.]|nr:sugar porter family MFS transporter [Legionella sp.]
MIWLVAMIGSMTGFLFGYDEGIIAGSLDLVRQYFKFSPTEIGAMASALPFGALIGSVLIGALLASRCSQSFGRRAILFVAGLLFLLGSLGTAIAEVTGILISARLMLGFAIGLAAVTTPLYLAETAPLHLRGAIVSVYQLAITIGIFCAYSMNYLLLEHQAWRIMFASSAIPAVLLLVGIFFLPESPRWLVHVGRESAALKALKRLGRTGSVEEEFIEIKTTLAQEPKQASWADVFKKPLLPVLMLGMILFCLQQLSGINVVIYFAPQLFKNLGFANTTGQILATMGLGLVNLLVTIIAIFCMDNVGRRKLLLFGFLGTGFSLGILAMFSYFEWPHLASVGVVCLLTYIFAFAISLGPIPHLAMSEIFPLYMRGIGMGLSSLSNWAFNTITVFTFPLLQHSLGIELTFALYAVICFMGFIYASYFMPETKNLSLEAIEQYLMEGQPLRKLGRKLPDHDKAKVNLPPVYVNSSAIQGKKSIA